MFIFWYFTLYTIMQLNGKYFYNEITAVMVVSACFFDMIFYSLVSQWVKRPNVGSWNIHKRRSSDTDPFKSQD